MHLFIEVIHKKSNAHMNGLLVQKNSFSWVVAQTVVGIILDKKNPESAMWQESWYHPQVGTNLPLGFTNYGGLFVT